MAHSTSSGAAKPYIPPHMRKKMAAQAQQAAQTKTPHEPWHIPAHLNGRMVSVVAPNQTTGADQELTATGVLPDQSLSARVYQPHGDNAALRFTSTNRRELQQHRCPKIGKLHNPLTPYTLDEKRYLMDQEYRLVLDERQVEQKQAKALEMAKAQQRTLEINKYRETYHREFETQLNQFIEHNKIKSAPAQIFSFVSPPQPFSYTTAISIGGRKEQQDCFCHSHLQEFSQVFDGRCLFAVFDGHYGPQCADVAAKILPGIVAQKLWQYQSIMTPTVARFNGLKHGFVDTAMHLRNHGAGYDEGTTAIAALVEDDTITIANAGDCRALVVDIKTGATTQLSTDARAEDPEFQKAVTNRGGACGYDPAEEDGPLRVTNMLEPSRGLGDGSVVGITPRPKIVRYQLPKESEGVLLVLASDGIFANATTDQIGRLSHYLYHRDNGSLANIPSTMIQLSLNTACQGITVTNPEVTDPLELLQLGADNMTATVVAVKPKQKTETPPISTKKSDGAVKAEDK